MSGGAFEKTWALASSTEVPLRTRTSRSLIHPCIGNVRRSAALASLRPPRPSGRTTPRDLASDEAMRSAALRARRSRPCRARRAHHRDRATPQAARAACESGRSETVWSPRRFPRTAVRRSARPRRAPSSGSHRSQARRIPTG